MLDYSVWCVSLLKRPIESKNSLGEWLRHKRSIVNGLTFWYKTLVKRLNCHGRAGDRQMRVASDEILPVGQIGIWNTVYE